LAREFRAVGVFGNAFEHMLAVADLSDSVTAPHGKVERVARVLAAGPGTDDHIINHYRHLRQVGRFAVHFDSGVGPHPAARSGAVKSNAVLGHGISKDQASPLRAFAPYHHVVAAHRHWTIEVVGAFTDKDRTAAIAAGGLARL
jgi:hypothetical protein